MKSVVGHSSLVIRVKNKIAHSANSSAYSAAVLCDRCDLRLAFLQLKILKRRERRAKPQSVRRHRVTSKRDTKTHCRTPGAATASAKRFFGTSITNLPPCNVSCSVPSGLAEFQTAPISTFLLASATLVGCRR